jgi:Putative zinc-finger
MAERTHIPSSPACGHWETLLPDALDRVLSGADQAVFAEHMACCPGCADLFEESRRGQEWLRFLSPEPDVPCGLVDRILAHTGPGHASSLPLASTSGPLAVPPDLLLASGAAGPRRLLVEPRLIMTAAMAFFSIALTLNMAGVRLTHVRFSDLRPTAVRAFMERQLTIASVPIIRYYDHLRFVYEVESKMRELRGTPEEGQEQNQNNDQPKAVGPGESRHNPPNKDGGSRVDPPQQSSEPGDEAVPQMAGDYVEASLKFRAKSAHPAGPAQPLRERNRAWIA